MRKRDAKGRYISEGHLYEVRTCICGCGDTFLCRIDSNRQILNHHNFKGKCNPFKGKGFSDSHRRNISKSHIGIKQSEESRRKISKALTGRRRLHKISLESYIANLHETRFCACGCGESFVCKRKSKGRYISYHKPGFTMSGKHHSEETKKKMADIKKGKARSKATREKLSKSLKGRKLSLERRKAMSGEKSSGWQGGKSFEPYSPNFNQQLKDRIRVRDNFKCQFCGVPELECETRLIIHHVNYDKTDCELSNLISLCRSCHCKTNWNRKYWAAYFRKEQRV